MAVQNIGRLALAVVVIAGMLSIGDQVSGTTCGGDLTNLVAQCRRFVLKPGHKVPPSLKCCALVQKINVPCACSHITREMEKIYSMEKVVYVAGYCGKKLAGGTKCGSFKVPRDVKLA